MHRQPILSLLATYRRHFPTELKVVNRITDFVKTNASCFQRQLTIGHITGSAWLLDQKLQCVLLTHHKKLDIWVQLGGHADSEADIKKVSLKEAREESGIQNIVLLSENIFDIDIHLIPACQGEAAHYHYDCRFLLQAQDAKYVVSKESHNLAWIPLAEVSQVTTEASILRMVRKTKDFISPIT